MYRDVLTNPRFCQNCFSKMEVVRQEVTTICDPPLITTQYKCGCGYFETVTFEDDWMDEKINIVRLRTSIDKDRGLW